MQNRIKDSIKKSKNFFKRCQDDSYPDYDSNLNSKYDSNLDVNFNSRCNVGSTGLFDSMIFEDGTINDSINHSSKNSLLLYLKDVYKENEGPIPVTITPIIDSTNKDSRLFYNFYLAPSNPDESIKLMLNRPGNTSNIDSRVVNISGVGKYSTYFEDNRWVLPDNTSSKRKCEKESNIKLDEDFTSLIFNDSVIQEPMSIVGSDKSLFAYFDKTSIGGENKIYFSVEPKLIKNSKLFYDFYLNTINPKATLILTLIKPTCSDKMNDSNNSNLKSAQVITFEGPGLLSIILENGEWIFSDCLEKCKKNRWGRKDCYNSDSDSKTDSQCNSDSDSRFKSDSDSGLGLDSDENHQCNLKCDFHCKNESDFCLSSDSD